jgi:hypothetical protein
MFVARKSDTECISYTFHYTEEAKGKNETK